MQNADVIIVGAGPAGSSAAIRLAQNGICLLYTSPSPRDS